MMDEEYTIVRRINRRHFWEIERSDGAYYFIPKRQIISGVMPVTGIKVVARVKYGEETTADMDVFEKHLTGDEQVEITNLIIFREMYLNKQNSIPK